MIVMIIEDDEGIAQALSAAIELRGDSALIVSDPRETLEYCLHHKPAVIFLDLLLSGMDGTDTALMIKNCEMTREIPIIMMSAHPIAAQKAKEARADAFLPKPFSIAQVFELIDRFTMPHKKKQ